MCTRSCRYVPVLQICAEVCTVETKRSLSLSSGSKGHSSPMLVNRLFYCLCLESIKLRWHTSLSERRIYLAGGRFYLERKNKDEKQDKAPVMR